MVYLLQLEWKKLAPNRAFQIAIGMYIVLLPLLFLTVKSGMSPGGNMTELQLIETMYEFPNIWDTMSYWASWLTFFLLVYLSVWIISSEMSSRTLRQNLITGMERRDYLFGKVLTMLALSAFATIYMAIVAYVFGLMAGGYGNPFSHEIDAIGRFFVQNMFYMSFAFMLTIVLRRSGLAMMLFFAYILIIERIIRYLIFLEIFENLKAGSYLPASAAWDVVPFYVAKKIPSMGDEKILGIILPYGTAIWITIAYIVLFLGIAYRSFAKRDL